MRVRNPFRLLTAALLVVAASVAWLLPTSSLYRGYVAGRSSGALVFSIVQAIGTQAVAADRSTERPVCDHRDPSGLAERLRQIVHDRLTDWGVRPRRT